MRLKKHEITLVFDESLNNTFDNTSFSYCEKIFNLFNLKYKKKNYYSIIYSELTP